MVKRLASQPKTPKTFKRQKFDDPAVSDGSRKEISAAKDLNELIVFDQSYVSILKGNVIQIEDFVRSLKTQSTDSTGKEILLEFLNSSDTDDPASTSLAPLFQSWSFALETGNDGLLRAIPALLATVLEATSGWIEFRAAGMQLCRALLLEEQRKYLERCLIPERQRAGAIINTLRLLTQIVTYDGGSHASALFRQRDIYRSLEKLLTTTVRDSESPRKEERHFSVRYSAITFFLANLRHQSMSPKTDLLVKTPLVSKMFHNIERDPPDLILNVLQASERDILKDHSLSIAAKQSYVAEPVLVHCARLLRFDKSGSNYEPVAQLAHEFLLSACLFGETGVDRATESWTEVNAGLGRAGTPNDQDFEQRLRIGGDGVDLVKPRTLSILLDKMRPHGSLMERSLALAIFEKHPNQIAEYFSHLKAQFDPKLTAYWVGYSSFLLSVISLPLPTGMVDKSTMKNGEHVHNATLRACILPQPLTRDVLERCFTKGPPLATFFATKILLAAFSKLEKYLRSLKEDAGNVGGTSKTMLEWFSQQCPSAKTVLAAYSASEKHGLLREQLSRLLSQYCELTPKLIIGPKVDMAGFLATGLEKLQAIESEADQEELSQLHMDNLLRIASFSPDIKWTGRMAKGVTYSPLTSVLRTCVFRQKDPKLAFELIKPVLQSHSILQTKHPERALAALLLSLQAETTSADSGKTFAFLDNCIEYLFKYDMKYISMLYELVDKLDLRRDREVESFSLLTVAIGDQWQFVVSSKESADLTHIARWIGRYVEAMDDAGESRTILRSIRNEMAAQTKETEAHTAIKKTLAEGKKLSVLPKATEGAVPRLNGNTRAEASTGSGQLTKNKLRKELDAALCAPSEPENYSALTRWKRKDAIDALDDGTVAELAACLSSASLDIRRQGLTALQSFIPKLQASELASKTQLYLLLSEVIETAEPLISSTPLPHLASSLVQAALPILQDPLHVMYPKVNDFLLQRPAWAVSRLPSYWLTTILLQPPSVAGAHARELAWLLALLHAGLKTDADAELYRGNGVVERLLSRCSPGAVPPAIARDALRLIYRWTFFSNGADTLVTRCGILAWIETGLARCGDTSSSTEKDAASRKGTGTGTGTGTGIGKGVGRAEGERDEDVRERRLTLLNLLDRVLESADPERLERWSDGAVKPLVARLRRMYDR